MSVEWIVDSQSMKKANQVLSEVEGFHFRPRSSGLSGLELMGIYRGRAYKLCRTDLKDDVCTFQVWEKDEQLPSAVGYWKSRFRYGVRMSMDVIAPIDVLSDG